MHSLTCAALAQTTTALKATILADTNRDGIVDDEDNSDKKIWSEQHGALFLANIGDANKRCSQKYSNITFEDYEGLDNKELESCNDASGNVQRNPKYLAPLRVVPCKALTSKARGSIYVSDKTAAEKTRVFVKEGDDWTFVSSNYTFTADELRHGLELGIDARDVRRPSWDGRATVHLSIKDGDEEAKDSVTLRVAPLLTHHHLQEASRVFAVPTYMNLAQTQYLIDLANNTEAAGIERSVHQFEVFADPWPQDMFEPGYTSIPGPDGPVVLRVMIRSAQEDRFSGKQLFTELRNENVGAVQYLQPGGTIDSFGNLEAIPPHSHDAEDYPAGRVIMGAWGEEEPLVIPFLRAQETQNPLILDTLWLYVGHVDEFLQFLPADNERGWVLMADDPLAGLELLKKVSEDGHGDERIFSRPKMDYDYQICVPHITIDEQLANKNFTAANEKAAKHIEGNIEILKNATGLTDDEIFRVPSTFQYIRDKQDDACEGNNATASAGGQDMSKRGILSHFGHKKLEQRQQQTPPPDQVLAYHPATINGIVLSDSFYLAAKPWGPVVDGKDILAEAVRDVYAKAAGYEVTFIDDWISHHINAGEIHCGSNTWRDASAPWW